MLNAKDVSRGLSLVATITLVGCTGTESLDTVPVEGMVTMNDSPVEGATVVFTPAGGEGHAAAGVTDASGRFQLTTEASGDGAVPGSYKVKITKYPKQGDAIGGETDMDAAYRAAEESGEYVVGAEPERDEDQGPQNQLPAQYADPNTSGLNAEVTANGENNFTFDL